MRLRLRTLALSLLSLAPLVGCHEDDTGEGALRIYVSGEGPAREGYPFVKGGFELAFIEGWEVDFDHVVVSLGSLRVEATDGAVAHEGTERYLAELTTGDPTLIELQGVTARRWDRLSFEVMPATAAAIEVSPVDPAIRERMVDEGLTYYYEGVARRDDHVFAFRFGLRNPTRNSACTNGVDGTAGVVVPNGSQASVELSVHLDHMFWDTLGSEKFEMRFDAIAAADLPRDPPEVGGDGDGEVTFDELVGQRLSDLRGLDGEPLTFSGQPVSYDPASTPLSEPTLRGFILASTATQVHLNGLGLCTIQALE